MFSAQSEEATQPDSGWPPNVNFAFLFFYHSKTALIHFSHTFRMSEIMVSNCKVMIHQSFLCSSTEGIFGSWTNEAHFKRTSQVSTAFLVLRLDQQEQLKEV